MHIIPFEELYHTEFFIYEAFSKPQRWQYRGDTYSCLNKPKPSHTLLWFKNCRGIITSEDGTVLDVPQNALVYTAKDSHYVIRFLDTNPTQDDTIVIHFQMTDRDGTDIAPTMLPELCIGSVDVSTAVKIEMLAEEFKKNIVCLPEANAVIYRILASVCRSRRKESADFRYACIKDGIDLLESDSDRSIQEIAKTCGVSECYFRRLFKEYSGESPMEFRQKRRIERAKQMLRSEMLSVGEIAEELHFADVFHFSKTFKALTGQSPREFQKTE